MNYNNCSTDWSFPLRTDRSTRAKVISQQPLCTDGQPLQTHNIIRLQILSKRIQDRPKVIAKVHMARCQVAIVKKNLSAEVVTVAHCSQIKDHPCKLVSKRLLFILK